MSNPLNIQFLPFAPSFDDKPDDKPGRAIRSYAIDTDLGTLRLRTVKMKADYLAHTLREAGVEKVSSPSSLSDFDPSSHWSIVIRTDESIPVFEIFSPERFNTVTVACLLSTIYHRHTLQVCKGTNVVYTCAFGRVQSENIEFN